MAYGGPSVAAQPGPGAVNKPVAPPGHAQRHPVVPSEHTEQKRDLTSWWKSFKRNDKKEQVPQGIFGVPLSASVGYANVAISLFDDEGKSYIYGYVPIIVAKCGVFLKEKATDVEGIFRLAGSEKRIKELKLAFDSPDRYGKGLDWTGFTVHDAANILRRYFNQLPEPIIPLDFYDKFRHPITGHQAEAVGNIDSKTPGVGGFNRVESIRAYQALITEIPPLNRQLLLYILDLLAVFASKSDLNKMTTANLSAIFQPGILSHPQHDMAPEEYRLSQDVLIFLIENQDHFLIGMQGTAADPETVRAVQSGATVPGIPSTPTTPTRSRTLVGRSSSNASAGAESVRKWGGPRRNVSVSSKHSKQSEAGPVPVIPSTVNPTTPTGGVHRSNTVPSRRGAGAPGQSPRFSRDKSSDPPTPNAGVTPTGADASTPRPESVKHADAEKAAGSLQVAPPQVISASSSEVTTPLAGIGISSDSSSVNTQLQTPRKDTTPLLATLGSDQPSERAVSNTPSANAVHGFLGFLKQSPTSDGDGRKPNKLQKKRVPGSSLSSAQSSTQDLPHDGLHEASVRSPIAPSFTIPVEEAMLEEQGDEDASTLTAQSNTPTVPNTPQRHTIDSILKPTISPTHSYQSQTDQSDADLVGDDMPAQGADETDREKKKQRWRLSRAQNKAAMSSGTATTHSIGATQGAREQASRSTFASSQPRRSFQESVALGSIATESTTGQSAPSQLSQSLQSSSTDPVFSDSEKEKKGPMSWIRSKIQERKDKEAEKRSKTPERNRERAESKQEAALTSPAFETDLAIRKMSMEHANQASTTAASTPFAPTHDPATSAPYDAASINTVKQPMAEPNLTASPSELLNTPAAGPSTLSVVGDSRPGTAVTASEFFKEAQHSSATISEQE